MEYKKWECIVCGWIYDEEQGHPDEGIEPGTKWEDIPDDWVCPECEVAFEKKGKNPRQYVNIIISE